MADAEFWHKVADERSAEIVRLHDLLNRAHGMILHGPASSISMHRLTDEIGRTIGLKTDAELLSPQSS